MCLTVGDLEAQQTNEKEGCDVGEVIAHQVQVFLDAHDGCILRSGGTD
jgi:hypothetical protein